MMLENSKRNETQQEFLRILKDYIYREKSEYTSSSELAAYAKSQEVEGILYKQTKDPSLKSMYDFSVYTYQNRLCIAQKLQDALGAVPHFFVKGFIFASYYPNPSLRTMGDVDLVVKETDLPKLKDILLSSGFTIQKHVESVLVADKGEFEFEIHTSLIHSGIGNERAKEYFSNCWDYVKDNVLEKSYHFLFSLQHLKGHIISSGAGFRQFMDIALFSKDPELNWDWITGELQKLTLLDFAKTVFAFNKRWFGVEPPIPCSELDEAFFYAATERIFSGGVFGHNDSSNRNTFLVRSLIYEDDKYNGNKQKICRTVFVRQLLPSYASMCKKPYCSYVKRGKYLLPIAWVHRMFYKFFDKRSRAGFINRTIMNDEKRERLDMLKRWGI